MSLIVRILVLLLSLITLSAPPPAMAATRPPMDVALVLDDSGSMREGDPQFLVRQVLARYLGTLAPDDRAALLLYHQQPTLAAPFTHPTPAGLQRLRQGIDAITYKGQWTNTPAAVERALYLHKIHGRPHSNRAIVLITDGVVDTGDPRRDLEKARWLNTELAQEISREGIRVFGVAFTDRADFQLLQSLSLRTGGDYFRVYGIQDLRTVFQRIHEAMAVPEQLTTPTLGGTAPQGAASAMTTPVPPPQRVITPPSPPPAATPAVRPAPTAPTPGETAPPPAPAAPMTPALSLPRPPAPQAPVAPPAGEGGNAPAFSADEAGVSAGMADEALSQAGVPPEAAAEMASDEEKLRLLRTGFMIFLLLCGVYALYLHLRPRPTPAPPQPHQDPALEAGGDDDLQRMREVITHVRGAASGWGAPPAEEDETPTRIGGRRLQETTRTVAVADQQELAEQTIGPGGGLAAVSQEPRPYYQLPESRPLVGEAGEQEALARLVDLQGVTGRSEIPLTHSITLLSRSAQWLLPNTTHVHIPQRTVSRQHAVIEFRDYSFFLRDLGSTNGTFLNDARVEHEVELKDGDRISIVENEFLFRLLTQDDKAGVTFMEEGPGGQPVH